MSRATFSLRLTLGMPPGASRAAVPKKIPARGGRSLGTPSVPLCVLPFSAFLYLPKMSERPQNRGRRGTSIAFGAGSSSQSRRPARSRLAPKLEQLPEALRRPRIQDRARAQAFRRAEMPGFWGIDVAQAELVIAAERAKAGIVAPGGLVERDSNSGGRGPRAR